VSGADEAAGQLPGVGAGEHDEADASQGDQHHGGAAGGEERAERLAHGGAGHPSGRSELGPRVGKWGRPADEMQQPGDRRSQERGCHREAGTALPRAPEEHDAPEGDERRWHQHVAPADGVGGAPLEGTAGRAGQVAVDAEGRHHAQGEQGQPDQVGGVTAQRQPAKAAVARPARAPCR
jgi:hypothetical protein